MRARDEGLPVAHAQLRHLNPMPANMAEVLGRYTRVLVPELNTGQLALLLRGRFGVALEQLNKIKGRPFTVEEVLRAVRGLAAGRAA
jgi:2-oxoglutarate ferredoxin oxidoreductase subunit alpha